MLTRLKRLLIDGFHRRTDGEALGRALSRLPQLEAAVLADNSALAAGEQQQRLWEAWRPAPQHLRSLELQCGSADELPPAAAPTCSTCTPCSATGLCSAAPQPCWPAARSCAACMLSPMARP